MSEDARLVALAVEAGVQLRRAAPFSWEALRDGKVVGSAQGGPEGELLEVSVLSAHRRQGVGRCLVRAVISDLMRAGISSMRTKPSDASGRGFCENLGGKALDGGAYGWTDLKAVAKCAEKKS